MDQAVSIHSLDYLLMVLLLAFARGMDFLSTWVATPNLVLEGNPIAKKLGWGWGALLNVAMCLVFARWPAIAIAFSTTSLLVAARNFQSAWLMRSLGEEIYRDWHVARIQETRLSTYLLCLAGNTLLTAFVGFALLYFGDYQLIPCSIGMGIIAYAIAVAFYSLLAFYRIRRSGSRFRQRKIIQPSIKDDFLNRALNPENSGETR